MKKIILLIAIIVIAGAVGWGIYYQSRPGELDEFSQCLKNEGAVFYGAFWCSHCQNQKKMFGKSAKLLPYVECSTSDGKAQIQLCQEKGIEGYPTWEFADGTRLVGEISLGQLSEKTGCSLP